MSTAQQAVMEAQERLIRAQADIAKERKAEAKTQLEEVRATGRKLRRELDAVVREIE